MGLLRRLLCLERLDGTLNATKKIRVKGVRFEIKKINPLDYIDGSQTLIKSYDIYENKKQPPSTGNIKKIQKHYADVFCAAVVSPRLSRNSDERGTLFVDKLFVDWELVQELYVAIMLFTYGKKKLSRDI